jgi:hypothetical protein
MHVHHIYCMLHTHTHTHGCAHACEHTQYIHISTLHTYLIYTLYIYIHIHTHTHTHIYICIYIYIYICVYIYIYIYIYIHVTHILNSTHSKSVHHNTTSNSSFYVHIQPYTYNIHAHATCPNPSLSCRVLGRLYRTLLQGAHTLKNIMNKHFPGLLYLEPCRHPWDRTAGHIPSQGLPCHNSTRRVSETSEKHWWTVLTWEEQWWPAVRSWEGIPCLLWTAGISLAHGSVTTVSAFTVMWCFPCVPVSVFQALPVMISSHWVKGPDLLHMPSCQQSCQTLSAHKATLWAPGSYNFNIEMEGIQLHS